MAGYIEREAIFSKIVNTPFEVDLTGTEDCYRYGVMDGLVKKQHHILDMIAEEPAADVVEVVRCKDCKLRGTIGCVMDDIHAMKDDDFCSYGERRSADEELN